MIVYGSSLAPAVRKVLAFIAEKGLAADHQPVPPHDALPEFRAASPFGQIPGFSDGGFALSDSTAICHYLERKYPRPALFPTAAADYGRMVWLDQFANNFLGAAECKVVMNRVVKRMRNEEPDARAIADALDDELPPLLDYLEGQIDGPFLVGRSVSLADLAVASPFASLRIAGYTPNAAKWPRVSTYVEHILCRAAIARIKD